LLSNELIYEGFSEEMSEIYAMEDSSRQITTFSKKFGKIPAAPYVPQRAVKAQSQYTASHISQTNNLRSLTVIGFLEPAPLLPIPWILNFFRHIQEFDVQKVSLRQLTLHISRRYGPGPYGVSETPWTSDQQDEWTAVDTLFTEPRFNSLEMVNVKLAGYSRTAFNDVREILLGKMSLLEGLGKLKIELTTDYPYLH
ncbi:hypothetical protein F5878DRAFT_646154, partial [Lentinula raphanica]